MTLTDKEKNAIALIEADSSKSNYFFQKAKDLKWFYPLKERNHFSPDNISFTSDGYALFWNVLDYLERVSEQVTQNLTYGPELIEIIKEVVNHSQTKKIKNYHIWWFLIKIINNIPNSIIKDCLPAHVQDKNGLGFISLVNEFVDPSQSSELAISELTEKLLPKFLNDATMGSYAEVIVQCITRIKPKGKINPLTNEDEVALVWSDHWILKGFAQYSNAIGAKCSNLAIYSIADHLKAALQFSRKSHSIDIDINGALYQFKVERVLRQSQDSYEIEFEDDKFRGFVFEYTEEQIKQINIEKDYWKRNKIIPSKQIVAFQFQAFDIRSFLNNFRLNLPDKVNWQDVENLEGMLEGLFGGVNEDYSSVWCKSLSHGPEHRQGTEEVLTIALRDCLLGKCLADPSNARIILTDFFTYKYPFPIFKKCVLVCIKAHWEHFNDLFTTFLSGVPTNRASTYEAELFDVFVQHNGQFSQTLHEVIKKFLESVPEYYVKEGEEAQAYWRFKWLSALKNNPLYATAYQKNVKKAKLQEEKPFSPDERLTKGGFITHASPLSTEEVLIQDNQALIDFLSTYVGADEWSGAFEGKPDKEGLKETLHQAAKMKPEKFIDQLSLFKDCHYEYVNHILWGIKDAWNEGKLIAWDKLFDFCLEYLSRGPFAKEAKEAEGEDFGKGKYIWIIDSISDLISSGSMSDERAFDPKYFPKVYPIHDRMLTMVDGDKNLDTDRDAINRAINTSFGHVTESFIIFSLRVARVEKKVEENWGRDRYQRFLNKGIEAYTFLGRYLPQFNFLDKAFVNVKIDELALRTSADPEWQGFIEGYLAGSELYLDLYTLMRAHYIKVIENKLDNERIDRMMVRHLTLVYLNGKEDLKSENSLFLKMLLDASTPEKRIRWNEALSCVWSISERSLRDDLKRKEPSQEFKAKAVEFWRWLFEFESTVRQNMGDSYNQLLGQMLRLTIFLDRIDSESERWLLASVPYIEQYDTFFIEYLTKFKDDESVRRTAAIYLKLLESSTPVYQQQDVLSIVETIYKLGLNEPAVKNIANEIAIIYGKRNVLFLKELWLKYNTEKKGN